MADDRSGYDEIYQAQHARVLRLCRVLLADPDEADDVSQEVFLKLLHEQRAGRDVLAWDRWLTTVAVNACRDRRRSGWWKWWRVQHHELDDTDTPHMGLSPEEAVAGAETARRVWGALRTLSARQQEIFALRQLEGWSTEEVAQTLGLSPGSVKRHLFRAVQHLRAALRGYR